jgi:hypothetical protein
VENREVTLAAFLDTEGAFDSTSHSIIIEAAKRHGLEDTICHWISFMLGTGKSYPHLQDRLEGPVARDASMEGGDGILLPLLWSLVVDKLIGGLKDNGCYTLGCADDLVILVSRNFPYSIS